MKRPAVLKVIFAVIVLFSGTSVYAQEEEEYVWPQDTAVSRKLGQWQDLKFGLFMHWGTYSQWGIVESWSICPEDEGWTKRSGPYGSDYITYKSAYEKLQTTFNPVKFNPEKWAAAAGEAGMKYVVFTTKHHDGFCMFDTKQTDYKITSSKTPFSTNSRSNITKEVFRAFDKKQFMIGAYFSKPDWHSEYYWWPYFPPKNRHVNYDPAKYPERWQKFKDYTYNQIKELTDGTYGRVDILWLDGGWVRPLRSAEDTLEQKMKARYNQDIDMPRIAAMGRKQQPGLIVVDRTVPGVFENYTTPEQQVPDKPLDHPWESCITMGNSWSYVPGDHYKSADEIISLLVKIVSRGGSLLMNIGVGPDGDWDPVAYERLKKVAGWMKINGEGIYKTQSTAPYSEGNIFYTRSKKGNIVYAFVIAGKDSTAERSITCHISIAAKVKKVSVLGGGTVAWKVNNGGLIIDLSKAGDFGTADVHIKTIRIEY